jgi:Spy/CpxP family protein refolding chaperone
MLLFGAMFIAFQAGSGHAQGVLPQPGGGVAGFDGLLLEEGVQKDLKLSDEQILKTKEVIRDIRQKITKDFDKTLQTLSPEERRKKASELMKAVSQECLNRVSSLLKAEQVKRLKQIELQRRGLAAFSDPAVEKALKLTEDQKEKLKMLDETASKKMREALAGARSNFQEAIKKMYALRQQFMEQGVAILTAEQKQAWRELAGEPYEVKLDRPLIRPPEEKKPGPPDKP